MCMRMVHNFFDIGDEAGTGLPYGWLDKCNDFYDSFLTKIIQYQKLIT